MKTMTKEEMVEKYHATHDEADRAMELFDLLKPGLKIKRNGRIDTSYGDKTPLGLYRVIKGRFQ